jgi:hypothetical protein
MNVTADDVLQFAKSLKGHSLQTIARKKEFIVDLHGDSLMYTPLSTRKPRSHERKYLEKVCDAYSQTGSMCPADYLNLTRNASYTLALIAAYKQTINH